MTEVGVLALADGWGRAVDAGQGVAVILALVGMIPLALLQLWPTVQLARLSDSQRGVRISVRFCGVPPSISSVTSLPVCSIVRHSGVRWPGTRSTPRRKSFSAMLGWCPCSWRPGQLFGVGEPTLPSRRWRSLGGLTVLLSLGPYAPGFEWLIRPPWVFVFSGARPLGTYDGLGLVDPGGSRV